MNGRTLNRRWKVGAKHALYRKTGKWYHRLERFPGALFDPEGYVLFRTEEEYKTCEYLVIHQHIHVPEGISAIPSYVQVVVDGEEQAPTDQEDSIVEEPAERYEGKARQVELTVYERDPKRRTECLEHYGLSCQVCDFDFEETYGKIGAGLIHVHHLNPLSQAGEEHEVDPVRDLIPVCPNCHMVIHQDSPPYEPDEVRNLING